MGNRYSGGKKSNFATTETSQNDIFKTDNVLNDAKQKQILRSLFELQFLQDI